MLERSEHVGRQAAALKVLAERHRIPVVVTNQVTARPTGPAAHAFQGGGAPEGGGDGDGHSAAALGTKWAHGVNVRLVLERQGARRFIKVSARARAAAAGLGS
jgi:RAD51-like protein 1